jgi:malate/lactate dehydrogenase
MYKPMEYYRYRDLCLCPCGGTLPDGALSTQEPFAPLVLLVSRDPLVSRGLFAIHDLAEMDEPEGISLLLPEKPIEQAEGLARFVAEHGACVANTAFSRWLRVLQAYRWSIGTKKKVNLVGLGNVGGTTATALKLLGSDLFEIGLYDTDFDKRLRYEAELNQVLPVNDGEPLPNIVLEDHDQLFRCDALLFTAAQFVPDVGAESGIDVRMMQYQANRELLRDYARRAREADFTGLFAQISDPVDHLSRAVFLMSNQNERGEFDWNGLLPEQVRGFGLGVMHARAIYCARQEGVHDERICAFGPHGKGLVVANAPNEGYTDDLSRFLTQKAEEANLEIRKIGYKPYIAPGISSAAVSVLRALRGQWHDAAVPLGGVYFGCRARFGENGPEVLRQPLHEELVSRLEQSYDALRGFHATWAD